MGLRLDMSAGFEEGSGCGIVRMEEVDGVSMAFWGMWGRVMG